MRTSRLPPCPCLPLAISNTRSPKKWTMSLPSKKVRFFDRIATYLYLQSNIERDKYLKDHENEIVLAQAHWRGYTERKAYQEKIGRFKSHEDLWKKVGSY